MPFLFSVRVLFGRLFHCNYILILPQYAKPKALTYQYFLLFLNAGGHSTWHLRVSDSENSSRASVLVQCLCSPYQYLCSDLGSLGFEKDYFSLVFTDMLCLNNLQCLKRRLKHCSDLSVIGKWNTDSAEKKASGNHTDTMGPNPPRQTKVCLKRKESYFYCDCFLLKFPALKIFFRDYIQIILLHNCAWGRGVCTWKHTKAYEKTDFLGDLKEWQRSDCSDDALRKKCSCLIRIRLLCNWLLVTILSKTLTLPKQFSAQNPSAGLFSFGARSERPSFSPREWVRFCWQSGSFVPGRTVSRGRSCLI